MSMLLGPLLSLWIGVSEPDGVPVPPPPPLPEQALLRNFLDWISTGLPFRIGPLAELHRGIDPDAAIATDPAVLQELEAWSKTVRNTRTLEFTFNRFVYDRLAGTEARGRGVATSEGHRTHVEVRDLPLGASGLQGRYGRPLRVVAAEAELLTSNEHEVFQVGPDRKRTHIATFPPQWTKPAVVTRPLFPIPQLRLLEPFYEFDAAARARAYRISFGNRHQPGRQTHLVLVGRSDEWQREFDRVEVLLRADTHEPMAIRWIETGAIRETVYVFENVSRK